MQHSESNGRPKVLIVDDRPDNLYMLETILEPLEIELIQALSGKEALQLIKGKEIAVSLIDIRMPEMDGVQLATAIQNDKSRDKVPVIFVTGQAKDEVELEKFYASGAVDFILKPFSETILINKVMVFLELYTQKNKIIRQHTELKRSEELMTNIIENLPLMLFLKEAKELRFVRSNKAAEELLGFPRKEMIGKSDHDLFPREEADFFVLNDRKVLESRTLVDIPEEVIHTVYKGERTLHTRKIPILNAETGVAEYLLGISEDITEHKQAEEEFRNIFNLSSDMMCVGDIEKSVFKKVNPAFSRILGYPEEDFIGNSVFQFIHPDDRKKSMDIIKQKLQQGEEVINFENRYLCKNGTTRWLNWVAHPVISQGVIYATAHDMTHRKKVEDALTESEEMYRTLLNASPEGIIIMDIKGKITEVSNIILEIFGTKDKKAFIGEFFTAFIPPEEQKKSKEILEKTKTEGLVQNIEFLLKRKDQSQFICEISTTLIQEANGKPKAYMAVVRDVTQRKKVEQQLIRTERMISLGEMASAMAHEINQPLLSITLGIENLFLKMEQVKATDIKYFRTKSEKIFEDISRIGRIIDHVRAFSRDHDEYIHSLFSINDSIKNAISMISEQFKHHSIHLTFVPDKKMLPVVGNTYRFEQVILNLLSNSKDAVEEKMKVSKSNYQKSIIVKTWHDTTSNYIEITDNGIGIKSEDLHRIIHPFYTTKDVGKGTGLGLSISYGIIKELNGNIEIKSDQSSGTTFTITLPLPEKKERKAQNVS